MSVLQLIASANYISVNKVLISKLGLEEAILLGELASLNSNFQSKGALKDGYFFATVERIEQDTTLSEYKQRLTVKNLIKNNIIEVKMMDLPAKRYFKINEEAVVDLLQTKSLKNYGTCAENSADVAAAKFSANNNILTNNFPTNKKQSSNEDCYTVPPSKKSKWREPTVEEVRAYCQERNNGIDAEYFIDYYKSNGWMVGKKHMVDWKASVRTWERNNYNSGRNNQSQGTTNPFLRLLEEGAFDD